MKINKRRSFKVSNPQEVEFFGEQFLEKPEVQLFTYSPESFSENKEYKLPKEWKGFPSGQKSWLNIHGLHDTDLVNRVCLGLGMPRFITQDILDTRQRTKVQDLGDYLFFSVKSILPTEDTNFELEQISFILGKESLFSFQEKKGDHFEHVRVRIREDYGLVRERGPDFLLFLLLEGIMDNYFSTISQLESDVNITTNPLELLGSDPSIVYSIETHKQLLLIMRKNVFSLKEALNSIYKGENDLVEPRQLKYFFDLIDNCQYLLESVDSLEMRLGSTENLFFSMQSHHMNQVMTTLTILAAIFIPLTFLAGIYGMNFEFMPELTWRYGYFMVLGVMLIVLVGMLYYFKKKKWF